MKIKFAGADQTVTGSQHLITVNGKNILLDCGLAQGKRKEAFETNRNFPFSPSKIDAMILSHAHLDHAGNIPHLVKSGFSGHIYATSATLDLCQLMLRDSAFLQEKDIKFVNKKRAKQNKNLFEPLYVIEDVETAMQNFIGVQYNKKIEIFPGIDVTFLDAGHILGSAGIMIEAKENGKSIRLGFSGDIGRPEMPIISDPQPLPNLDALIMESTYGGRLHPANTHVEEETTSVINEVIKRGGKIIIPAFAVGRTQLLVYELHNLFNQNKLPVFPIFVDSPLAINVTEVYRQHPECFDTGTYLEFLNNHEDPFGFSRLTYVRDVNASKKLNDFKGPCMIISASGMAEGGRILHHLANNIEDPNNMILFAGYAAKETLARKIMDGMTEVNILGSPYNVRAQIKSMDYFSAHADQKGLVDYANASVPDKSRNIFIVHGEPEQSEPLIARLTENGFTNIHYPKTGDTAEI